jgi:hypothetical protein
LAEVVGAFSRRVFAALQRGRHQVRAEAQFVLEQVAAQVGLGAIERGLRLVDRLRVGHLHAGAVDVVPLGRPREARGAQRVGRDVVLEEDRRLRPEADRGVVACLDVALEQGGVDALVGRDLQAQLQVARGAAVAVAVGAGEAVLGGRALVGRLHVEALALFVRDAERVVQQARLAAHAAFDLAQAVAAEADAGIGRDALFAALGEQLDHAADGVRAVHRGGRAAQHFDAVDLRERNAFPAGAAGRLRVDAHAVQVDRGEARLRAADEETRGVAHAAVARDLDARLACQHVGHAGRAAALDGLAVDDGDIAHQVRQRLRRAVGRDHRLGQRGCCFLRERGQRDQ